MEIIFKRALRTLGITLGGLIAWSGLLQAQGDVQMCVSKALLTYLECAGEGAGTAALAQKQAGVKAVDLIGQWVSAGAPETEMFEYTSSDNDQHTATFKDDILPLFTKDGVWFEGARSCASCHFANSENAYHEMDLTSYAGIMKGGDVLTKPPGVPLFGQDEIGATNYDWGHSKLKARLRNNRMPPNWPEDLTETNRDGPCVIVDSAGVTVQGSDGEKKHKYGCELNTVGLIGAWVDAGAPELKSFAYGGSQLTFNDVLPVFTKPDMWFNGSAPCSSCHFANSEVSYHEMDLSSYAGIMKGGDVLSKPPGVPLFGENKIGATDYDWGHSKMRARLRNNRMPNGATFDITEENRDGPLVFRGRRLK
jgi:hypothetical protein